MWNIDLTNLLTATITNVNRANVIKFNNSWVHAGTNNNVHDFVMVYRAMVYHPFANPAPVLPGQAGTPWAAGWRGATGNATVEATVPNVRTNRYFDGVGVAHIQIDTTQNVPQNAIAVVNDTILEDTDGFEDPRIFSAYGQYYLHSHRYQPDPTRAAPAPADPVYDDQGNVVQAVAGNTLCVKVNELTIDLVNHQHALGPGRFYGLNVSTQMEKNYGFFEKNNYLCAVYGLTQRGNPLTVFQTQQNGNSGNALFATAVNGDLRCNSTQPNSGGMVLDVENYINDMHPGAMPLVMFSSSGPLIPNPANNNTRIGVGHVKILHPILYKYASFLADLILHIASPGQANIPNPPANRSAAITAYRNNNGFADSVDQYFAAHLGCGDNLFAQSYNNPATQADRTAVLNALQRRLLRSSLADVVLTAWNDANGIVMPWGNNRFAWATGILANPAGNALILHPMAFYFSFFYELDMNNDSLVRLSNAWLVHDQANPAYLQFAENVAPLGGDLIMGFGENDNRVKFWRLSGNEYNQKMIHVPQNFNRADFQFLRQGIQQTVL
ncbi:hypothetical protein [Thalassospira indica]|uniref:Uncharacterized protein n=1 Tax=Thalassospira indica TaxID=1891279 RepID=A0ABM6Y153_9PROT|nr:hypothetical protein [Thalassospira indica]AXO15684.1 hypothetical protein DY252_16745 [Thalassospira indica]OAZ14090.1 hypothetical protein TH15_07625 [Thalassospira profundimaris]